MWRWRLPGRGTSGINRADARSAEKPVNKGDLAEGNGGEASPGEHFAKAQPALGQLTEPELDSSRAKVYSIAIAQEGLASRLAVDRSQSVRLRLQDKALTQAEVELEVPVPHPIILELQIGVSRSSEPYRKTAGHPNGARLFPRQDLKLDHYQSRRGT